MKKYILFIFLVILCFSSGNVYSSERKIETNIGLKAGMYSLNRVNSLNILSLGGTAGFIVPFGNRYIEAGLEWDFNLGYFGGDRVGSYTDDKSHIRTIGVYGVVRTIPFKEVYAKGKIGVTTEKVTERINNVERIYQEGGLSCGMGVGYNAANNVNIEAEFTTTNSDMNFLSVCLRFLF